HRLPRRRTRPRDRRAGRRARSPRRRADARIPRSRARTSGSFGGSAMNVRILLLLLLACVVGRVEAAAGPGPGPRLRPKPGRTDEMLRDKAMRLQPTLAKHISPEGLLVYEHTR